MDDASEILENVIEEKVDDAIEEANARVESAEALSEAIIEGAIESHTISRIEELTQELEECRSTLNQMTAVTEAQSMAIAELTGRLDTLIQAQSVQAPTPLVVEEDVQLEPKPEPELPVDPEATIEETPPEPVRRKKSHIWI